MKSLNSATQIHRLAEKDSTKPIYVLVNSPGGSALWGGMVISAIELAKSRGIAVECFSSVLAASMAFNIMLACSKNYVFNNSKLLFHPVRVNISRTILLEENAKDIYESLRKINTELLDILEAKLTLSRKDILSHYKKETSWQGKDLAPLFKDNFFQLVTDIKNVLDLFDLK
jgi:ATP-dependent protease ClpP protease subunit